MLNARTTEDHETTPSLALQLSQTFVVRAAAFALLGYAAVFGLERVFWPSIYWTVPLFAPFYPYTFDPETARPNELATWATPLVVTFIVVVAAIGAVLGRRLTLGWAFLAYLGTAVAAAVLAHVVLNMFGFTFIMETP